MPISYEKNDLIFEDSFNDFSNWHHEGAGKLENPPAGGLRLQCLGSRQGSFGCMAFLKNDLPDHIAIEYDVIIQQQEGLMINYLAIRGINGEDLIKDIAKLPPRTGIMPDYFDKKQGLQSYHVSISRFNDKGEHSETSNWRRNPGGLLVGHGNDPCKKAGQKYHLCLTKSRGACQLFVDEIFAHGFVDWNLAFPLPDYGKFGFRLIGANAAADIANFKVYSAKFDEKLWLPWGEQFRVQ